MNRLQTELQRLYLPISPTPILRGPDPHGSQVASELADAERRVRALVVELRRPIGWQVIAALWQGVQAELELPAPAIAVNGVDGYQVWFSLQQPIAVAQGMAFLEALRQRYLSEIASSQITLTPSLDAATSGPLRNVRLVPAVHAETGHWSAFLAPDLAGLFADEPWLDLPPSPDAQADLLLRLQSIKPADFLYALERLRPVTVPTSGDPIVAGDRQAEAASTLRQQAEQAVQSMDPRSFLLAVMRDPGVLLSQRIEAAKALLPYFET